MAAEQAFPFSVASVVEEVLQQQGLHPRNIDLASKKKAEEDSLRRYEAAGWLRKTVGVVGGKDLPAEPSEEEFRLGLRSGIILCNVLNKVQPGAVSKPVEGPCDSVIIPDGAPLNAYQYSENVRNFLVAIEQMGLPTFKASDLESGGESTRVVNSALALKSYSIWKKGGGNGVWKFSGTANSPTSKKNEVPKNSEELMNSLAKTSSAGDSFSLESSSSDDPSNEAGSSRPLRMLLSQLLSNKQLDEIPSIVECMIGKVTEEFEHRLTTHKNMMKASPEVVAESVSEKSPPQIISADETRFKMEEETSSSPEEISSPEATSCSEEIKSPKDSLEATSCSEETKSPKDSLEATGCAEEESCPETESCLEMKTEIDESNDHRDEELERQALRRQMLLEQQQRNIEMLKGALGETKAGMQILQMKYQEEFNNLGKRMHSVAYAASEYRRVLEENRKLYNHVQDLKGNIRVYCRVRPFLGGHSNRPSTVDRIDDQGNMSIMTSSKYAKEGRKSFSFNKVFGPSATQEEVFSDTQPLIRSVLDGYNVCIFAYGQTGSGKTFTMSGPTELTEDTLGVNYRALSDLFVLSQQRRHTISYDIYVQMLEIYNDQIRDLLVTDSTHRRLEVRNSSQNGINVPEACLVPVSSTSDVISLMDLGQKNRAVSSTAMNDRSSRSHSCLTVHVQGKDLTSGASLRGCMHLVDLAGSERVDKSEVTGDRLKEAQHINKSLSALGDVISSLAQKNAHVPYRNSKLTQLLQDSLGGQAKTLMFVHISPEPETLGETLSTLKFAERVSTVELGAARVNKDSVDSKELKEQIASLKAALARKDSETEHHSRSSTPEKTRMKSFLSSPSLPSWKSVVEMSVSRTNSLEDVRNAEAQNKPNSKLKRRSLEPRDMLRSTPWPPLSAALAKGREDDKESVSSDWDDKLMVNKNDNMLPEIFDQNFVADPSKVYPENLFNSSSLVNNKKESQEFDVQRNQYEMTSTDDSDDHEAANSETSEPEVIWQSSLPVPKGSSIPNALGPKTKKTPNPKQAGRSPEIRSFIPSLIPSPSRKPQGGVAQPTPKAGKQAAEGKRRGGYTK